MKKAMFVIALFVAVSLGAQEAKVIQLEKTDSRVAQEAWDNLQQAQKTWDTLQQILTQKYLQVNSADPQRSNKEVSDMNNWPSSSVLVSDCHVLNFTPDSDEKKTRCAKEESENKKAWEDARKKAKYYREGWENGFVFSSDFKYIVPKAAAASDPHKYPTNIMDWVVPAVVAN